MIESSKYDKSFFTKLENNSAQSALTVVPIVADFIKPRSVIDVGCGTGMWLRAWHEAGVEHYLGVEGPYVEKEMVKIPPEKILFRDLKQPTGITERFDLAMSVEVGEHLPDANAAGFVKELTSLSDVILFSAALPGQEGTYHINLQYPEYWAAHFKKFNYVPVDCIRPFIWNNPAVEYWYQQNILLFVKADKLYQYPALQPYAVNTNPGFLTRIHPFLYELKTTQIAKTSSLFGFLNWKWYLFKRKYLKKNAN
jgi:SAM-dependent methyltransferase